ncbi:hypothetical protein BGZ57DRAFT_829636, partial [Hyaloscypha finlandica]
MPVGSSLVPWLRRPENNNSQWPNPQDSTGTFYRRMGRDALCWEAVGKARETFIQIAAEIKEYLEKHSDPVPHPVTWTIYMIGRRRETCKPTIMFCCRDSSCRKQVRTTIEGSGILNQYQNVRIGDASSPPDFDQLVQLAGESFESIILGLSDRNVNPGIESLKENLYTNTDKALTSVRNATAGGILRSGERHFYLTAGHAFESGADPISPHDLDLDEELAESDSSESSGNYVEHESRPDDDLANRVLHTDHELRRKSKDWSLRSKITRSRGSLEREWVIVGSQLRPLGEHLHAEFDYALIESHHYFRDIKTSSRPTQWKLPHPPLCRVVTRPRDSSILSITASSGLLKGTISGTPSYATTPGSRKIQELWTVRFEGTLTNGDCGSWVVDAQNGELFGHIVDGSPESGVAHVVPTYRVFEDARTRFQL